MILRWIRKRSAIVCQTINAVAELINSRLAFPFSLTLCWLANYKQKYGRMDLQESNDNPLKTIIQSVMRSIDLLAF